MREALGILFVGLMIFAIGIVVGQWIGFASSDPPWGYCTAMIDAEHCGDLHETREDSDG